MTHVVGLQNWAAPGLPQAIRTAAGGQGLPSETKIIPLGGWGVGNGHTHTRACTHTTAIRKESTAVGHLALGTTTKLVWGTTHTSDHFGTYLRAV